MMIVIHPDTASGFLSATACEFFHKVPSGEGIVTTAPVLTPAGLEAAFDLTAYYPLLIYVGVIAGLAMAMLAATQFFPLKPYRPTPVKQMTYESGMDPVGTARMQFDVRFYLIAILFLVFDVELLFLHPWAVIAYESGGDAAWRTGFGMVVFVEIMIFISTLVIAYLYAWRKGVFQWR
jgi:NADH-quinone oxidoreductase subunit A